jgi:hypothetical protein
MIAVVGVGVVGTARERDSARPRWGVGGARLEGGQLPWWLLASVQMFR